MSTSTSPVSLQEAKAFADELDAAIMEVLNGERKAGKIPLEPMARLIQFVRDLTAQPAAPAVVEGWQLVPKELTAAMILAGLDAENNDGVMHLRPAWRYMLAAAPTPPEGPQP